MSDRPGLPDTIQTIPQALAYWEERTPEAPALILPGRPAVTYATLWRSARALADSLHDLGITRGDRVVLLLPDGPELATALLATMCVATAVPLEATLPIAELTAALRSLSPAAAFVGRSIPAATRACCHEGGVGVFELEVHDGATLEIGAQVAQRSAAAKPPQPHDLAILRRTSGTTGRPKWVARSHASVFGLGRRQRSMLHLSPDDRAPSVAPMSQTLGQSVLLHSILNGGALICPPHQDISRLWESVVTERPTWMSVPAGFLELLARYLRGRTGPTEVLSLRFVQVTSAPISAETCAELERRLGAPVLPKYSSSEAGTVALALPPPATFKPGSVGQPVQELRIVDAAGHEVGPGVPGEVWIRGRSVVAGYLNDPELNATAFTPDGWFRSGDLGYLDDDGFLFLAGRLNELINRGGTKIAPTEVDDALLGHPAVRAAAAFAVPDERLGEDIVAAVVCDGGATVTPRELRRWLLDRLAVHKVPRRIWFVDELPLTESGKVQRGELARRWREKHQ